MKEWLAGKKTYFLVAFGLLGLLVQVIAGDIGIMDFFQSQYFFDFITFLGLGTLRAGVTKSGPTG